MQVFYADTPEDTLRQIAQQLIEDGQSKINSSENMRAQNEKSISAGSTRRHREMDIKAALSLGQELRVRGHFLLDHTKVYPTSERPAFLGREASNV